MHPNYASLRLAKTAWRMANLIRNKLMVEESRRRELLEELVAWAGDPNAHDWTRVDADDPYEDDGYTFPSRRIS